MSRLRVVVLAGGLSHERDVSLRSGARVANALSTAGVDATVRDADSTVLPWLREERPDCVVPLLHGEVGEDGSLREVLELADVAYVGATPAAARVAFDKPVAKHVVRKAGLSTPDSIALHADTFREIGAAAVLRAVVDRLGLPLFVKPARGGSALGGTAVRSFEALPAAMVHCFSYGSVALIERCIDGTEVAVPVLELATGGPEALPAVEIRPDAGVYDYHARYTAGATEFVVPGELADATAEQCAEVAVTAHQALGLRDICRVDLIIDSDGTVWFLEANVAPGMTETSLTPLSIEAAGLAVGRVFSALSQLAVDRNRRTV